MVRDEGYIKTLASACTGWIGSHSIPVWPVGAKLTGGSGTINYQKQENIQQNEITGVNGDPRGLWPLNYNNFIGQIPAQI